jgi:hypothetical protein
MVSPPSMQSSLPAGWLALPGGCRTLWITKKGFRFRSSSFPGLFLTRQRLAPGTVPEPLFFTGSISLGPALHSIIGCVSSRWSLSMRVNKTDRKRRAWPPGATGPTSRNTQRTRQERRPLAIPAVAHRLLQRVRMMFPCGQSSSASPLPPVSG